MLISCQYITSDKYFPICVTAVANQRRVYSKRQRAVWIVQRSQCDSDQTNQDLCKEPTDKAVPCYQDIDDCQRERSHPSRQCCMPMAWTDGHAMSKQGTSCWEIHGICYQRRSWEWRGGSIPHSENWWRYWNDWVLMSTTESHHSTKEEEDTD